MSDYAGPILGVVGAVVGFVVTGYNPQGAYWGWAIGSALGGMYSASQQVIPGPKIGDVQKQTSQEGGFRPIVFGRSIPMSGNVIADSDPEIVKKQEPQDKGGPKVESEYAYRTYAVGFCEGEAGLLQAWRNGILVADFEDPSMSAENAKFLEYATWHTGTFDQNADPDLESIYGVGNAPFFRGTAYLVLANEDVTDQRGAWSQWQVRVFRGHESAVVPSQWWLTRGSNTTAENAKIWFSDDALSWPDQSTRYPYIGEPLTSSASARPNAGATSVGDGRMAVYQSVGGGDNWIESIDNPSALPILTDRHLIGKSVNTMSLRHVLGVSFATVVGEKRWVYSTDGTHNFTVVDGPDAEDIVALIRLSTEPFAGRWVCITGVNGPGQFYYSDVEIPGPSDWTLASSFGAGVPLGGLVTDGITIVTFQNNDDVWTSSGGASWSASATGLTLNSPTNGSGVAKDGVFLIGEADGAILRRDGGWSRVYLNGSGAVSGRSVVKMEHDPSTDDVVASCSDNTIWVSDDFGLTWVQSSLPFSPSAVGDSVRVGFMPGDSGGGGTGTDWTLPEVIDEVCSRVNLTSDLTDLSLIDPEKVVRGYTIGNSYMAAGILQTLSGVFFFDPANKNGKVAFVPRGRDAEATILQDDMIDNGEDIEERKESSEHRKDGISIPRVLHLNYHDVAGGLNTDKQRSERPEGTRAEFEQSLQTPVVLNADEAASVVAITHGLMAEQQKGELNFALPDNWLRLIESDPVFVETDTKMVRAILARVQTDEGEQRYKAVRDRQSLYTTVVQGIPAAPVTRPPSSVAGVTLIEFLDIPILRDSHDQLGFRIAVSGLLPAWPGANVELSLDGGATYILSQSTTSSSIMGELVSTLGDHPPEFPDEVNTCQVQINTPDTTLENTDLAGMMNRMNRAIIGDEIVNFADTDEVSEGIWELSHWLRGRKQTDAVAHSIGDRFAMLDTTLFIPAELTWLGQTLTFRATTFGRPVDEATIISATFNGASQTEFQPSYLQARRDGTDVIASWQGVGRLGGGAHVAMGAYFQGFRITLTDGSVTQTFDQTDKSLTTSLSAFTGPVTVRVQQRNQLTGLGPYIEVII